MAVPSRGFPSSTAGSSTLTRDAATRTANARTFAENADQTSTTRQRALSSTRRRTMVLTPSNDDICWSRMHMRVITTQVYQLIATTTSKVKVIFSTHHHSHTAHLTLALPTRSATTSITQSELFSMLPTHRQLYALPQGTQLSRHSYQLRGPSDSLLHGTLTLLQQSRL